MVGKQRKAHGIMICVPAQGHINPFVSLALKLASKGFTITFVHLEYIHRKLSKAHHGSTGDNIDFFLEARQSGLDIRYTTISDGFPLEFDRDANFGEYWEMMMREFEGRVDGFVGKIMESEPDHSAYFLLTDTIFWWPAAIADKYKLVNVSFWTEPANVFSQLFHWDLIEENGHYPCNDDVEEEITYIPGIDSINTRDMVSIFKVSQLPMLVKSARLSFERANKADFVLHNTVDELESTTISALNKYMPNYAIGPINFSKNLPTSTVSKSFWSESDCTSWLESKPPASVLYVSFGSIVQTNKQLLEEIAYGLLLSEVYFIWVIRQGILSNGEAEVLPAGYEDMIGDRGLIVSWSNQIMVLLNPAVGGFLTHNGWNSTVESIWCGVPMMCYPLLFDQPTNRKLVVDDWKIGINLCDNGTSVDRTEVAAKIRRFMDGGISGELRENICEVERIMQKALEIDGSSERNLNKFIRDLEEKLYDEEQM